MAETAVDIIPVIDLQHGLVVRAKAGERARYAPIVTPLSATADPVDVAQGLLAAVPAKRLYVADLDGIEGRGSDHASLARLAAACPGIELWVDSGFAADAELGAFLDNGIGKPVLGSESQGDGELFARWRDHVVLSLDFRGEGFLGPRTLLDDSDLWPEAVIVMTLARVGTGTGPDTKRLAAIKARAPNSRVYAAGGLRGPEDLRRLEALGIAGVLVASALHDGRLGHRRPR
ncbi:HisA/HisF-related TIM barrel protein [Chelatococcus sp. GCM10030263]|uniref:HisA/HisF-related TIM barrel protein n=1 Tax=Chelatococcus sp. GCM10030263 TaxID=3273387 RepID=UPI0036063DBF